MYNKTGGGGRGEWRIKRLGKRRRMLARNNGRGRGKKNTNKRRAAVCVQYSTRPELSYCNNYVKWLYLAVVVSNM